MIAQPSEGNKTGEGNVMSHEAAGTYRNHLYKHSIY